MYVTIPKNNREIEFKSRISGGPEAMGVAAAPGGLVVAAGVAAAPGGLVAAPGGLAIGGGPGWVAAVSERPRLHGGLASWLPLLCVYIQNMVFHGFQECAGTFGVCCFGEPVFVL